MNIFECKHPKCLPPQFDRNKAYSLTAEEVRKLYPRFCGQCPDCKCTLVLYASFEHYIAGDW